MAGKLRCHVCNKPDCRGWKDGDAKHEFRGKGKWTLGCHCSGCEQARTESGGFMGALSDHLAA